MLVGGVAVAAASSAGGVDDALVIQAGRLSMGRLDAVVASGEGVVLVLVEGVVVVGVVVVLAGNLLLGVASVIG